MTKVDQHDKATVLEVAEFKLVDESGKPVKTDGFGKELSELELWKTDKQGKFTVKNLAPGSYQLI
ncbi:hypothetical protein MMJ63_22895, partial [Bacillus vallismortis]|nr:hypothetical protein [Bacillus vallismortis]